MPTSRVEIAAGHLIFPTREWKLPAVWNSEILKMSSRVIPFYVSRNWRLTKVDIIICHVRYSSRFNLTVSSHFHFLHWCKIDVKKLLIKFLRHRYFSQPTFACSKSTIDTLEQGVKYGRVSFRGRHCTVNDIILHLVLLFLLLTLN